MYPDRTEDIERGVKLVRELREVEPDAAGEEVRAVYEEVRERLRVPFVNFIFRVLANYPEYLSAAWGALRGHLLAPGFEEAANGLRARALIEPSPGTPEVDLEAFGDLGDIQTFADTIHYALPKLLLVVSALDEGLDGNTVAAPGVKEGISPGVAEGTAVVPMVSVSEAASPVREIFEEIRGRHGHPQVASYYRGIAQSPELLAAVWEHLKPLVGSEIYLQRKQTVLREAGEISRNLSGVSAEEARVSGDSVAELRAILAVFRFRVIPDTFLEVVRTKALLDGPEAARRSRFSFTG